MTKINFQQAKEFLDNLKPTDKVAIITHTDLDGLSAGILFLDFCKNKKIKDLDVFLVDYNKLLVSTYEEQLQKKEVFLISDLPPNIIEKDLERFKDKKILYTDHHQETGSVFGENVYELRTLDQGYVPSSRTVYELCGGKDFMALVGTLSDFADKYKENDEFIAQICKKYKTSIQEFKENKVFVMDRMLIYFSGDIYKGFEILKKIKDLDLTEIKKYSDPVFQEINFYLTKFEKEAEHHHKIHFFCISEPRYPIKSYIVNSLSSLNNEDIFVLAVMSKDKLRISFRNQSRKYNVEKLVKEVIKDIPNSTGGGHTAAAACILGRNDLEKFKENLKKIDLEKFRN